MAHDHHDLGPCELAGELHAAEDVLVFDVPRHPAIEDVSEAEVHDHLGRRARVDTTEKHGRWILTPGARSLLSQVVAVLSLAFPKTLVALFHDIDDLLGRHPVTLRLRQGVRAGRSSRERETREP